MKKGFCILGIIVSLVIVVFGILMLSGAFNDNLSVPSSSSSLYSSLYDSGYAKFGGDFYTYVNNNAAKAADAVSDTASAVRTLSSNLRDIYRMMERTVGFVMIGFGLFGFSLFGAFLGKKNEQITVVPAARPAVETKEDLSEALPEL